MVNVQGDKDQKTYLEVMNLMVAVVQSLKGKEVDWRLSDLWQLAAKLFFHVVSIYWLRQGSRAPVSSSQGEAVIYDFASVSVLARTILDTYFTMFEVFFEPANDDDLEYAHALWQLSGFIIRENYIPSDPSLTGDYVRAQEDIKGIRERLSALSHKLRSFTPVVRMT